MMKGLRSQARELSNCIQLVSRVKKHTEITGIGITEKGVLTYLFQGKHGRFLLCTSTNGIAQRLNCMGLEKSFQNLQQINYLTMLITLYC